MRGLHSGCVCVSLSVCESEKVREKLSKPEGVSESGTLTVCLHRGNNRHFVSGLLLKTRAEDKLKVFICYMII